MDHATPRVVAYGPAVCGGVPPLLKVCSGGYVSSMMHALAKHHGTTSQVSRWTPTLTAVQGSQNGTRAARHCLYTLCHHVDLGVKAPACCTHCAARHIHSRFPHMFCFCFPVLPSAPNRLIFQLMPPVAFFRPAHLIILCCMLVLSTNTKGEALRYATCAATATDDPL